MINWLQGKSGLFFTVNALAAVGMNIGVVGVNWFIIDATGQNIVLGLYGAVSLVSAFLALVWGGALTDKYNKLSVMKYCCIGQAALFFITAALYGAKVPALWIIYGLAVVNMPLMMLFSAVSRGAVTAVWEEEHLSRGNAVIEITLQAGAMLAALLTGVLYRPFGFGVLIGVGGALTLAAGGVLVFSRVRFTYTVPPRQAYWQQLKTGFTYLASHKTVLWCGLAAFVPTVIISVSNTVIPGYVEQTLGKGALLYGAGDMCFAVGALLMGVLIARWKQKRQLQNILFGVMIASLLVLLVNRSAYIFCAVILLAGAALAGLRILLNTVFMERASGEYLGRSLSLLTAVSVAVQAVLSLGVGRLMDSFGAAYGYIVLIGVAVAGVVCAYKVQR